MKNYYQVLGLDRSATAKQIKQAYRELCKLNHPDLNRSAVANARMQEINEAYGVLASPVKKVAYDQLLLVHEQQGETKMDGASGTGQTGHCRCEKCDRVDSTLRVSVFTWVVSLLVITYRRGWAKVLCARCRTKYALLFDLQNFVMGWWGVPFGILWTLEALWHNSLGGQQPDENNALFLAGLGYELCRKGELKAALKALEASLKLKEDPRVKAFYWQTKAKFCETQAEATAEPQPTLWQRLATGALHPALYCAPTLALLFVVGYMWLHPDEKASNKVRSSGSMQQENSGRDQAHSHFNHDSESAIHTSTAPPARPPREWTPRRAEDDGVKLTPEQEAVCYELAGIQFLEKRQYTAALEPLRRAAMMGRGKAQYYLGRIYYLGLDGQRDNSEAAKWYAKAVRRGYLPAFSALALMYHMGWGVEKDLSEDVRLLGIAAENGDSIAQWELGQNYQDGQGIPINKQEALKWYRRAADQGNVTGQYLLGSIPGIYLSPETMELRIEEFKWMILAAKQGLEPAAEQVARVKKSLTTTNESELPGRKEVVAEAFRRANAFVPRKENTSEWLTDDAPRSGSSEARSSGTGFLISEDGYLLTNFHVVDDAMQIVVQCGGNTYPARLVKADPINDLALLKLAGKFKAIPVELSRTAKLGDSVFTVGFPNPQLQGVSPKLTDGKVSSLAGARDDVRYFQISVAVQPGNSGGALVNSLGNVVGIVTAQLSEKAALETSGALPQNVNYAIKSSYVLSLLESVPELAGRVKAAWADKERKFEDVVKEAQEAAALVLVY